VQLAEVQRRARTACLAAEPGAIDLGDADASRLGVYRRLVRGGLGRVLANAYPTARRARGDEWDALVAAFLETHGPRRPAYRDVPLDFAAWIAHTDWAHTGARPHLADWVAYDADAWRAGFAPEPDIPSIVDVPRAPEDLAWHPALTPALAVGAYGGPPEAYGEAASDGAPALLLATYRDPVTARTERLALSPEAFVLVDALRAPARSYAGAVAYTALYLDLPDADALVPHALPLFAELLARGILVGSERW